MERKMKETLNSGTVSTKLHRIAELAREHPDWALKTLAHVIDSEFLKEAFKRTRKDGAVGVDGLTAEDFERDLETNLLDLLSRFKDGSYRAPPVRRVFIPKGGNSNKLRPIGIPTFEDKVLQRAVAMVLESIYEQDFLPCSYGFRPGRSAHQALKTMRDAIMSMNGSWVLELDIEGYFDNVSRTHLREFLDRRVLDGVIRRTINKWLKAGVMDKGLLSYPQSGTPQGGVASPIPP
jgi:RNA-directed DNA polymerase